MTAAIEQYEQALPPEPPTPEPLYIEHPIAAEQTGESLDLGGGMELRAPWFNPDDQLS